jgi:hypothetical protein
MSERKVGLPVLYSIVVRGAPPPNLAQRVAQAHAAAILRKQIASSGRGGCNTQYELGRKSGVHPTRISEMERGQRAIAESVVAALKEILRTVPQMAESEERGA